MRKGRYQREQLVRSKESIGPTLMVATVHQAKPLASSNPLFQGRQHPLRPDRRFHPRPSGADLSGLLSRFRHSCRSMFRRSFRHVSTSLHPFAPSPLQGLLRSYGRSDSCPHGSSALVCMNSGSCHEQVSLIYPHDLPIIPSPTTPVSPDVAFARYPSARQASPWQGSGLRLSLAGSPLSPGRIEFVIILRTDRSPPVAPHPVLRRRSYSWLQTGERLSGEDFHLSDRVRFQAHECGDLSPLYLRGDSSPRLERPEGPLGSGPPLTSPMVRTQAGAAGHSPVAASLHS